MFGGDNKENGNWFADNYDVLIQYQSFAIFTLYLIIRFLFFVKI